MYCEQEGNLTYEVDSLATIEAERPACLDPTEDVIGPVRHK
jgi:hypothetical protein